METPREACKRLAYSLLCVVADALDTVLSVLAPDDKPRASLIAADVDALSDEDILELLKNAPRLQSDCAVYRLTPHTVVKMAEDIEDDASSSWEANALNLVFAKTTIPVPRVRRVVRREWDYLIVMDYVEGVTLAEVWSTLPVWKKIRIAFTLHRYIRQLQRIEASPTTPPGPLSSEGPRMCESPIFGQVQSRRGPFASYSELSRFFNKRCRMALDGYKIPEDDPLRKKLFDDSEPLVLTHQDLNPRNIMLDKDGRLWIIDWAWSGYYPRWFEYVTMQIQTKHEREVVGFEGRFWECLVPFVCRPYFRQERWLGMMSRTLNYK